MNLIALNIEIHNCTSFVWSHISISTPQLPEVPFHSVLVKSKCFVEIWCGKFFGGDIAGSALVFLSEGQMFGGGEYTCFVEILLVSQCIAMFGGDIVGGADVWWR